MPLLTSLLLASIKIPGYEAWLNSIHVNATMFIGLILISTAIINHFVTIISPFKKYEKLEKNKFILLDQLIPALLKKSCPKGYPIVANIRVPKKTFFSRLEPNGNASIFGRVRYLRKCFFKKLLVPIWISKGRTIHKRLKMTTKQGVSGKAFSNGVPFFAKMPEAMDDLFFSKGQISLLSGNGFVISHPVMAYDEKYNRIGTKIIAVVTLSCNKIGSESLLDDPKYKENLTEAIIEFANICSLIL